MTNPDTSNSRAAILGRVRQSLSGTPGLPTPPDLATPIARRLPADNKEELIRSFSVELMALTGLFHHCRPAQVPGLILSLMREAGATQALAWSETQLPLPSLLDTLRAENITVRAPAVPLAGPERAAHLAEIEQAGFGITGAEAALADVGGVIVRSGPGRARLASLLPETHVALVTPDQFHPSLYDWMRALEAAGRLQETIAGVSNLTIITGPSRTADIEKMLVLGVHGPKTLHVVCVDEDAPRT